MGILLSDSPAEIVSGSMAAFAVRITILFTLLTPLALATFKYKHCDAVCRGRWSTCMITKSSENEFEQRCYKSLRECSENLNPLSVCIDFANDIKGNEAIWPDYERYKSGETTAPTPTSMFKYKHCDAQCQARWGACMIIKNSENEFVERCYKNLRECSQHLNSLSICIDFANDVQGNEAIWPDYEKYKLGTTPATLEHKHCDAPCKAKWGVCKITKISESEFTELCYKDMKSCLGEFGRKDSQSVRIDFARGNAAVLSDYEKYKKVAYGTPRSGRKPQKRTQKVSLEIEVSEHWDSP